MAIFDIRLPNKKYVETVRGIYKYTVVLILFQILASLSKKGKTLNFGFSGNILNENFLNTLCLILIAYIGYMFVFHELVTIN